MESKEKGEEEEKEGTIIGRGKVRGGEEEAGSFQVNM